MALFYIPPWTALNTITFCLGLVLSISAIFDPSTPYSKFGNRAKVDTIPSRQAMIIIYTPSLLVCFLIAVPHWKFDSFNLVHLLTIIHFIKRVIEVCFVHIYKSKTNLMTMVAVMTTYTLTTFLDLLVIQNLPAHQFSTLLASVGLGCCLVGEVMNGYHHYLLRKLRTVPSTDYRLPQGGLFDYVIAPHYMFEQLSYLGLLMISQNVVSLSLKMFPFIYLTFRAKQTKKWYQDNLLDKKDRQDAKNRACLIPFIY